MIRREGVAMIERGAIDNRFDIGVPDDQVSV
jgi:hypothetical protein